MGSACSSSPDRRFKKMAKAMRKQQKERDRQERHYMEKIEFQEERRQNLKEINADHETDDDPASAPLSPLRSAAHDSYPTSPMGSASMKSPILVFQSKDDAAKIADDDRETLAQLQSSGEQPSMGRPGTDVTTPTDSTVTGSGYASVDLVSPTGSNVPAFNVRDSRGKELEVLVADGDNTLPYFHPDSAIASEVASEADESDSDLHSTASSASLVSSPGMGSRNSSVRFLDNSRDVNDHLNRMKPKRKGGLKKSKAQRSREPSSAPIVDDAYLAEALR